MSHSFSAGFDIHILLKILTEVRKYAELKGWLNVARPKCDLSVTFSHRPTSEMYLAVFCIVYSHFPSASVMHIRSHKSETSKQLLTFDTFDYFWLVVVAV